MNKKRFYTVFSVFCIIWIIVFVNIYYLDFWKKQCAKHYYNKAEQYLYELDNAKSTEYLIKAIKKDPELNSQELTDFHNKRKELLDDEQNYEIYFNKEKE